MINVDDINLLADLAFRQKAGGTLLGVLPDGCARPIFTTEFDVRLLHWSDLYERAFDFSPRGVFADFETADIAQVERLASALLPYVQGPLLVRVASSIEKLEAFDRAVLRCGWRRHPLNLILEPYLGRDEDRSKFLLSYLPQSGKEREDYSDSFLQVERNLHMDMLREAGRRADAHLARYTWAASFLRPNDVVLDAACGLGYGTSLLRHASPCRHVTGIDASDLAITYARAVYGVELPGVEFRLTALPDLAFLGDSSVDCVVSFETLEHLEEPKAFMREVERVLKPGGRFLASVPNFWADETGRDPSPYHLQTFDLSSLLEVCGPLRLDQLVGQAAGGTNPRFSPLRRFDVFDSVPPSDDSRLSGIEWWLISAMKDPLKNSGTAYVETVFPGLGSHPGASPGYSSGYENPWLVHALVHGPFRLRSPVALSKLAAEVVEAFPSGTADHGAGLAVLAYQAIERRNENSETDLPALLRQHLSAAPRNPHENRWQISLQFALAQLLFARGQRQAAREEFVRCWKLDFRKFAPHIATKTTEAAAISGRLALADGDAALARTCWNRGIEIASQFRDVTVEDLLIDPRYPHRWGLGDGIREYVLAWDNVAQCANGLHVLAEYEAKAGATITQTKLSGSSAELVAQKLLRELQRLAETSTEQNQHVAVLNGEIQRLTQERAAVQGEADRALREGQHHIDDLLSQVKALSHTAESQTSLLKTSQAEQERLRQEALAASAEANRAVREGQHHIDQLLKQLQALSATSREQANYINALEQERTRLTTLSDKLQADVQHQLRLLEQPRPDHS